MVKVQCKQYSMHACCGVRCDDGKATLRFGDNDDCRWDGDSTTKSVNGDDTSTINDDQWSVYRKRWWEPCMLGWRATVPVALSQLQHVTCRPIVDCTKMGYLAYLTVL